MRRSSFLRALFVALITALAVVPGTALGAEPIDVFHGHSESSYSIELCAISGFQSFEVNVDYVDTVNLILYADGSTRTTDALRATYTNPATGKSVEVSAAQMISSETTVDEEAGTITSVVNRKGLELKIQTTQGPVLLRVAGVITFATTFDLQTGDRLSYEVTIKGMQIEFPPTCAVLSDALT